MEYGFVFSKYGVMKYAGEIKNLEYHGKGMIYFNSKSYYVGEFEQGKREGRGVHYMDNGDRYIGSYS